MTLNHNEAALYELVLASNEESSTVEVTNHIAAAQVHALLDLAAAIRKPKGETFVVQVDGDNITQEKLQEIRDYVHTGDQA